VRMASLNVGRFPSSIAQWWSCTLVL
jgi:hypothetical protein